MDIFTRLANYFAAAKSDQYESAFKLTKKQSQSAMEYQEQYQERWNTAKYRASHWC